MNPFRSEEHVHRWSGYDPAAAEGTVTLSEWAYMFGVEFCRRKLDPDFFLHGRAQRAGLQALRELGKSGPF